LSESYGKDWKFWDFLKRLEMFQEVFASGQNRLLLSTHREPFDALFNLPPLPGEAKGQGGKSKGSTPKGPVQGGGK
jgi:hypothetical protein